MTDRERAAPAVSADLRETMARAITLGFMVTPEQNVNAVLAAISDAGYVIRQSEPTEAGILAEFGKHKGWTLNYKCPIFADDDDTEQCWQVLEDFGGLNDREWRVKGKGDTPADAIRAALATGAGHEA